MMPEMDGMAVLRTLKATPEYQNIPVILQTADGQYDHIEETMKAGAYCYLVKPYNEKILISAIESAIKHSQKNKSLNS
jgi:CheY-like chemotaxis protein